MKPTRFQRHSLQIRRVELVWRLVAGVVLECVCVVVSVVVEEWWWWKVMRERRRYERCYARGSRYSLFSKTI
jgi:hypothetical protein